MYMQSGTSTTAGGYPDYSAYCTPTDTKQFLETFWCSSLFENVGVGGQLTGLKELGQTVRFHTFGRPNVYEYRKNGAMEFDTASSCPVDYKLDRIMYSAFKFDETDVNTCQLPMLRKEWQNRVPMVHSEVFDSRLLCQLPAFAASCTQGTNAGAGNDINLGSLSQPVPISKRHGIHVPAGAVSVWEYMTRGVQAIQSFRIPSRDGFVAFVPEAVKYAMLNSDLANSADLNGSGVSFLGTGPLNGFCGNAISMRCGAEVRASNCIQKVGDITISGTPRPIWRIIWVWRSGLSTKNDVYLTKNDLPAGTPMGRLDVRMTITGAAVSHREGVAVGYVYLAD